MIFVRKSAERGHFDHGWLNTYHSFSFADYQDERHMGFRTLRVINEDYVQAGHGFPTHSHRDMEILTYILEGELEHKDSMGNTSVIRPGEIQRMTAGTGVTHSEFNASKKDAVHLLQIWIFPEKKGLKPGYEQKAIGPSQSGFKPIASRDGREGTVKIHQDVSVYEGAAAPKGDISYELAAGRGAWVQVFKGELTLNRQRLSAGDGAAVEGEPALRLRSESGAGFLLFDL